MSRQYLSRREWLATAGGFVTLFGGVKLARAAYPRRFVQQITEGLTPLWREGAREDAGGYAWESESEPHITPTFAVIGCYHLLGVEVPNREHLIAFLHKYPVPERRRTERPLWTFDYQQVQSLRWLDADIGDFRQLASTWTAPSKFPDTWEAGGNPVFQFQAAAVRTRNMLGLASDQESWRQYFTARRRPNGSFNNIPAIDDATGHVMNTWWGLLAMDAIGETRLFNPTGLLAFVQACQGPGGGFIYAPDADLGAVEDAGYTWAALNILNRLGAEPVNKAKAIDFLQGLRAGDGLFRETADGRPNPLGTWYVLESLALLGHIPTALLRGPVVQKRAPLASDLRVWTMQIEAPGKGSPEEAATVAEATGVHIWAARNPEPGWLEAAQSAADRRKIPVLFAAGIEEYGTLIALPGLGTYNHLAAFCVPPGKNYGKPMSGRIAHNWNIFRERRVLAIKEAGGRTVWPFNDNEELTRILLDDAVQSRSYAAISTFHGGGENFLSSQPWLQRWYGRLPFVALQDSHQAEPWWSYEQVAGFRTLFVAKEPGWQGWLEALDRNWVVAVRRDDVTGNALRYAGGMPEVRDFVTKHSSEWQWKNRPPASIVVLRPGLKFEAGVPASGAAIRVRLAAHHTPDGQPREPLVTLSELLVDGKHVDAQAIEIKDRQGAISDRYLVALIKLTAGPHTAVARILDIASKQQSEVQLTWVESAASPG